MNIEKKFMYMVYVLEVGCACPVWAYIEKGKVMSYYIDGDDNIEEPERFDRFFDTEEEANEYIVKRIAELKAKAKETGAILSELDYMEDKYDTEADVARLDDFIPFDVQYRYKKANSDYYDNMINTLVRCARDRVLEVADRSIPMDSISNIEWHDREWRAFIILHDGTRITTDENSGYRLLMKLYGHERKI